MTTINTQTRTVGFYYLPFVVDIFLRWLTMGLYRWRSTSKDTNDFLFFLGEQILITLLTFLWVNYRFRKLKQRYSFLREKDYYEKISLFSVVFRLFNVVSVGYIIYEVIINQEFYKGFTYRKDGSELFVPIMVFLIYGAFVFFTSLKSIKVPSKLQEDDPYLAQTKKSWLQRIFQPYESQPLDALTLDESLFLSKYDYHIDQNDFDIEKIEGRIKNEFTRVDAYVLESVMFGALAFSGFLSIVASERFNLTLTERESITRQNTSELATQLTAPALPKNKPLLVLNVNEGGKQKVFPDSTAFAENSTKREIKTTEIRLFWKDFVGLLDSILLFNLQKASERWESLIQPGNLIMMILIETLFCALFFISVIASRLRYSRMTEEIQNLIGLARNFNYKEEEVHNLVLQGIVDEKVNENLQRRLKVLDIKINYNLRRAENLLGKTKPILMYMSLFRNLGVITFLFVLITGSLYFSESLALIFLIFTISAYAYESLDIRLRMKGKAS